MHSRFAQVTASTCICTGYRTTSCIICSLLFVCMYYVDLYLLHAASWCSIAIPKSTNEGRLKENLAATRMIGSDSQQRRWRYLKMSTGSRDCLLSALFKNENITIRTKFLM